MWGEFLLLRLSVTSALIEYIEEKEMDTERKEMHLYVLHFRNTANDPTSPVYIRTTK